MASSSSFLNLESIENEKCICKSKSYFNRDDGWESLKINALSWKNINISYGHDYFPFKTAYLRIGEGEKAFGKCHRHCRTLFNTNDELCKKKFGETPESDVEEFESSEIPETSFDMSRRSINQEKKICFGPA